MGAVVPLSAYSRSQPRGVARASRPAEGRTADVIILPVVRVDRAEGEGGVATDTGARSG